MSIASVLIPADKPSGASTTPRYSLLLSTDPGLIEAAQRLRYDVFTSTPGFALPPDGGHGSDRRDEDRFDEFCDHLLVRDDNTGELVGCYRMLAPAGAIAAGGLYTATEFDIRAFDPLRPSLVEMGRAVVRDGHRNGGVVLLMWAGILAYLDRYGYDHVTGCVSVPIGGGADDQPPGSRLRASATSSWPVTARPRTTGCGHTAPSSSTGPRSTTSRRPRGPRFRRCCAATCGWARGCAGNPRTTRISVSVISACCWANSTPTPDT